MTRRRQAKTQRLIDRTLQDPNFLHVVELVGTAAGWAESLETGHRIGHNDRNMVQIPVEVAMAFIRHHEHDGGDLGAACRKALSMLAQWRGISAAKPDLFTQPAAEHAEAPL